MNVAPDVDHLPNLVRRAREMVPELKERAAAIDKARDVPGDLMEKFVEAGFLRIFQPKRYGGYELDYGPAQLDLAAELGRGSGSCAWVVLVVACHSWMLGAFSRQAQDDVWANDRDALLSSGVVPEQGRCELTSGGATISGRWRFSSGVSHAKWALLGCPMVGPNPGPPQMTWALVPRSDFKIEDTWFVSGLAGTGSNDVVIEKAFVPEHRMVSFETLAMGAGPGGPLNASHIYRLPLFPIFPYNILAPALGILLGALETCTENVRRHPPRPMGPPTGGPDPLLLRLADAAARVDASSALLYRDARELNERARAGSLTPADAVRYQRNLAFTCGQFTEAMDAIIYVSGAHALFDGNPIQRAFRDMRAINSHIGLRWEGIATGYLQTALGLGGSARKH
jgi:3-hydroxy-9,10-secoandrosta-1,3,5(10)-triene-9,17-dione monooxygenase